MALIVYNRENSRPQEVTYKGKRTINLDSRGTVYLICSLLSRVSRRLSVFIINLICLLV